VKYDELDPEAIHVTRPGQDPRFDAEVPIAGGAMEVVAGGATAGPTRRALRRFLHEKPALVALAYILLLVVATLTFLALALLARPPLVPFDLRAAAVLLSIIVLILTVSVVALWRTTKFN